MTIENIPESYQGLYFSRAAAEYAAYQMQLEGRQTKIKESNLHVGQYVVYATPKPKPDKSTPVEVYAITLPEDPAPLDISNSPALLLQTYRNKAAAEAAAEIFQAEGRQTRIEPSQLHRNLWVVYATKLEGE